MGKRLCHATRLAARLQTIADKSSVLGKFRSQSRFDRMQGELGSIHRPGNVTDSQSLFSRTFAQETGMVHERIIGKELVLKGKMFPTVQRFYPNTAIFST